MNISKTQANKIINNCFNAIPVVHVQFSDMQTILYKMCLKAEKDHRNGRTVSGFTANQAAKYFTVEYLFQGLENPAQYNVVDVLHIRLECLYGKAYAIEYKDRLQEFKTFVENSGFFEINYSEMMKD